MNQTRKLELDRRAFMTGSAAIAAFPRLSVASESEAGFDYVLELRPSSASLLAGPGQKTPVWAYNGTVPGPVLRARKGREISIRVFNRLEQATSVHWHGVRIENAMDGVSNLTQEPIAPGTFFDYRFTPPDAGTFWYHPHNRTWEQLARGLYGALIVEENSEIQTSDRDYAIMVDDWRLTQNGLIDEASLGSMHDWSHGGRLGNVLTLNGRDYEELAVNPGERVRLRFINSANARIMRFGIRGHSPWLVALDGQPVDPVRVDEQGVEIAPAQRFDLMVDVKGNAGDRIEIIETSGTDNLVAGYLICGDKQKELGYRTNPVRVNTDVPLPNLDQARKLELVMSGGAMRFLAGGTYRGEQFNGRTLARVHKQFWAFNGTAGMDDKPFFSVKAGETVSLRMVNDTLWPHAIHLHGHHFQVMKRGAIGSPDLAPTHGVEKSALRDTVLLQRDEVVEIAFAADNPGKWMLHCHMLEHQASGMGAWFEVM